MLSLADRHEDRAKRIAANRTEPTDGIQTYSVGTATEAYRSFVNVYSRLSDDAKAEFDATRENLDNELAGYRSLAEAPDGSGDTMAGIGVLNTKVVPSATLAAQEGNGGGASFRNDAGWGETAPVTQKALPAADPVEGNLNGQALADQGAVDTKAAKAAAKKGEDDSK